MNIKNMCFKNEYKLGFPEYSLKNKLSFKGKPEQNTIEIEGTQTKAKVYTSNIDEASVTQIKNICSHPVFKDIPVRIMPDVHAGNGSVIGFTAPVSSKNEIIPGLISGDIGCGVLCCDIDTNGNDIDFKKLDDIIKTNIAPKHNKFPRTEKENLKSIKIELENLCNNKLSVSSDKMFAGLGTLGGGNHFIEIDKSDNGKTYLIIHSGSRNFGQKVFNYYYNTAKRQNPYTIEKLSYLTGDEAEGYLQNMRLAQKYAQINRRIIADEIIKQMGWKENSSFESVHNYIDNKNIIRKGAISAEKGKKVIIPLNMRDGAIIAEGKGNPEWNNSAPHGAGRRLSRSEAVKNIKTEDYVNVMKGIYTTSLCMETLDEAPQAYKDSADIEHHIQPTVTVIDKIRPQYNFKNKN